MFVPREALMSRANSLKKALKQIIEHAEQGKYKTRVCLVIIMCLLSSLSSQLGSAFGFSFYTSQERTSLT